MKNKIKEIREQKNITQEKLARLINVSNKTIYNIEKGDNTTLEVAFKIAKFLNKTIEEIWTI